MVYGSVGQGLRVKKLPEGIRMVLTGYKLHVPSTGSWWPYIDSDYHKNTTEAKKAKFPREVSSNINDGRICGISLSSTSNFDSGEGPSAEVFFALAGQVKLDSGEVVTIAQTGSITVTTPPWAGFWAVPPYHNPDTVLTSYNLAGAKTVLVSNPVTKSMMTKGLIVEFMLVADTKQLAKKVDTVPNFTMDVVNFALFGIAKGHEVAYSWVFGAIGGAPAALRLVAGILGTEAPKWLEDLVKK